MSKKKDDIPPSVRVRDNQRRSRARRQEYIKDLQDRVRYFELNGVAATQEMQQAARKVAQENARLRMLLARHGISQDAVESHLRNFDDAITQHDPAIADVRSLAMPYPGIGISSGHNSLTRVQDVPNNAPDEEDTVSTGDHPILHTQCRNKQSSLEERERNPTTVSNSVHDQYDNVSCTVVGPSVAESYNDNRNDDDDFCPSTPHCFCPPIAASTDARSEHGLEISCETAAAIIADMRGDTDRDSIRLSLGCRGNEGCNVKNTTVLQILDEA